MPNAPSTDALALVQGYHSDPDATAEVVVAMSADELRETVPMLLSLVAVARTVGTDLPTQEWLELVRRQMYAA